MKLESSNYKCIRVEDKETWCLWRLNADNLPSERRIAYKNKKMRSYQEYFSELAKEFNEIKFTHIGRDKNQFVDALATLAFMVKHSTTHKY
jgi:hypothetical protein